MNKFHKAIGTVIASLITCAASISAQTPLAPGVVDTSFAVADPENTARIRGRFFQALGEAVALQPDGKILVAGQCRLGMPSAPFCVARFRANGEADSAFGDNGIAGTDFPESLEASANHVAVLRNGDIIAAGVCVIAVPPNGFAGRLCYARFNATGTPIGGTNASGRVLVDSQLSFRNSVVRVIEGPAGRIAIAGTCQLPNDLKDRICVSGFNASDLPDGSFNGGTVRDFVHFVGSTPFSTMLRDMVASRSDQGLYLSGNCDSPSGTFMCVGKLGFGGTFATEFASGGFALVTNGIAGAASSVLEQFDGKVVVAGACASAGEFLQYCVGRFLANGTVDATFGGGSSKVALSQFTGTSATGIVQQPDGKLVAFSYCETGQSSPQLCVLRHQQSGALDTSLGFAGIARQAYPQFSDFRAQALRANGQLVIAGTCSLDICVRQTIGGPLSAQQCSLDADGDGVPGTSNDYLLLTRAAMGFTGVAALQGASFTGAATRSTWSAIRTFLVTQCGMSLAP